MKKLLVVLLALTVVGIFAFADDAAAPAPAAPAVKITGLLTTGYDYIKPSSGDTTAQLYDYWDNGVQARNNIDVSVTSGNFVYTTELGTSSADPVAASASTNGYPYFNVASIKGSFFDSKLSAEVGLLNTGDFTTLGDVGANYWGNSGENTGSGFAGLALTATPIDGLVLGLGLPADTTGSLTAAKSLSRSMLACPIALRSSSSLRRTTLVPMRRAIPTAATST